ncbi:MAG: AAA family ATPase [Deltaproteobacteria bacterium]|nr:AAA family ATPase [Deltaproteobacteria bacterium]
MRIDRLILDNFRCFEHLDLALDERMTLLVGTNGAGKTAVLDGLAIALGAWLKSTTQGGHEDRPIDASDARLVRQESAGLATSNPTFPVRISVVACPLDQALEWAREIQSIDAGNHIRNNFALMVAARRLGADAAKNPESSLPLIAYYGTGRLWVQAQQPRQNEPFASRMRGYASCLAFAWDHELLNSWMADREGDRLQRLAAVYAAGGDLASVKSPHLEAVENAALACLEGARRFFYSINHKELRVEFDNGQELPFSSLSDGQRGLIVLAADLAWRAAQLNPHYGADAPRLTKGVVLIDEIELHLHPQWQRTVIANLMRAFENVQFVMTTHSPQVVSTAQPEWMRVLHPDGTWDRVDYTYGRDSNALLRDVFGIPDRLQDIRERVARVEELLAGGDLLAAREALRQLEQDLGPNDDLVSGLRWEIADAETHGGGDAAG